MNCLHTLIQLRTVLLSVALASAGWCSAVRADGDSPKQPKPVPQKFQPLRVRVRVRKAPKIRAAQPKKVKRLPAGKVRIQRPAGFLPLGGFGFGGFSRISLLRLSQVQEELKLTDAQKQKVRAALKSHQGSIRGLFGGFRGLKADERRKKLIEIRKKMQTASAETAKAIDGILKPEQARRLREIHLQVRGIGVVLDGNVAKRLKLTAEQKTKITDLFKSQASKRRDLYRGMGGKGLTPDQRRKKYKEFRDKTKELAKETQQKVTAVLTEQQQARLKKMKGKAFKLNRRRMFRLAPQLKLKAKRVRPKTAA